MIYVYAGIAIAIIWGIRGIIRWYNLPRVAEARAKKVKARQEQRTERLRLRRRRWHLRKNNEDLVTIAKNPNFVLPRLHQEMLHALSEKNKAIESGEFDDVETPDEKRRWFFWRRKKK